MPTQFDNKVRVVAEANLAAMLSRMSGVCHRYWIERITDNFCYVAYSNPDEYGNDCPVQLRYPVYRDKYVTQGQTAMTVFVVLQWVGDPKGGRDHDDTLIAAENMDDRIRDAEQMFLNAEHREWYRASEVIQKPLGRIVHPRDPDNGQPPGVPPEDGE